MTRRNVVILTMLILLIVGGFSGYQVWHENEPKQVFIDPAPSLGCGLCSLAKKDLAEKTKIIEQNRLLKQLSKSENWE